MLYGQSPLEHPETRFTMRDISELRINVGGMPVPKTDTRMEYFRSIELKHGLNIPLAIKEFILAAGGGHPELDTIDVAGGTFAVDHFYSADPQDVDSNFADAVATWAPILGNLVIPIAEDGGGNQFYVDLASGYVGICLHDESMRKVILTPSFEAFIDTLAVGEDNI